MNCLLPDDLRNSILQGYAKLKKECGANISLAVRSSATAEDSPEASFEQTDLGQLARPKTQIMMNLGNPDKAFSLSIRQINTID
jgi:phosphoenolpyruvate synthase/pyruvate phosphate dikinase